MKAMKVVALGAALAAAMALLAGCGSSQDTMEKKVAALQQRADALEARVGVLEGQVQALTASLPDNAGLPDDSAQSASN